MDDNINVDDVTVFEAVKNGDVAALTALADQNPKCLEFRDGNGFKPLQLAAIEGKSIVIQWLAKRKIALDEIVNIGYSALHIACEKGYLDCVMALKMAGAKLNEPTSPDEYRPIHLAARNGNSALVSLLIQAGCPVKVKDRYGKTPLTYACDFGHEEIATMLSSHLNVEKPKVAKVKFNAKTIQEKMLDEQKMKEENYKKFKEKQSKRKSFLDVVRDENNANLSPEVLDQYY